MLTFAIKKKRKPSIAPKRHAPTVSPMSHSLHLQRAKVRHILRSPTFQPKLSIGQPNDKYEQEADRVADEVMRMPEPLLQRQVEPEEEEEEEEEELIQAKPLAEQITLFVQRQVEEEEEEKEEEDILQTKARAGRTPEVTPDLESRIQILRGGGQPLSKSVRNYFEPRFGQDFSQVRVHTNGQDARLARDINARAFTVGKDVVFGKGEYKPNTLTGQQLLAHELTHVLQQNRNNKGLKSSSQIVQRDFVESVSEDEMIQELENAINEAKQCMEYITDSAEWAKKYGKHLPNEIMVAAAKMQKIAKYVNSKLKLAESTIDKGKEVIEMVEGMYDFSTAVLDLDLDDPKGSIKALLDAIDKLNNSKVKDSVMGWLVKMAEKGSKVAGVTFFVGSYVSAIIELGVKGANRVIAASEKRFMKQERARMGIAEDIKNSPPAFPGKEYWPTPEERIEQEKHQAREAEKARLIKQQEEEAKRRFLELYRKHRENLIESIRKDIDSKTEAVKWWSCLTVNLEEWKLWQESEIDIELGEQGAERESKPKMEWMVKESEDWKRRVKESQQKLKGKHGLELEETSGAGSEEKLEYESALTLEERPDVPRKPTSHLQPIEVIWEVEAFNRITPPCPYFQDIRKTFREQEGR